eukprot:COSAG02_NODE_36976_length_448_cov_0.724928_1_plen_25_part_10
MRPGLFRTDLIAVRVSTTSSGRCSN